MTYPSPRARITLVEDHALFAESMEIALGMGGHEVRRIQIPDGAGSPNTLLPLILRSNPQIVLLDLDLGAAGNGVRLVQPLSRAGIAIVVITSSVDRVRWGEAIRYGARCVLPKDSPFNTIIATIRKIGTGQPVMDREERESLLRLWHQKREEVGHHRLLLESLTPREAAVLGYLMQGRRVREIARTSVVSEATIRTQVKSILAKLDVGSQIAAVGLAHQAEWHPPQAPARNEVH